jgi:hypothetical protein
MDIFTQHMAWEKHGCLNHSILPDIEWILMISRAGMADSALDARYLKWTLIGAILATIGLVSPVQATNLKDIRIGEYTDYTRVVFEFDKPIDQEDRIVLTNSRMTLMFQEAEPHLVRKIPFHRSKRINNLQIWVEDNKLSIVFLFEFAISRYETFRMRDPFRIALDIYPQIGTVTDNKASIIETKQEPIANSGTETLITMSASGKETPLKNQQASPIASASIKPEIAGSTLASGDPDFGTAIALPPQSNGSQRSDDDFVLSQTQPPNQNNIPLVFSDQSKAESKSPTSSLQYYLIIALVILTIVILGLLMMMLMARNRWTDDNKPAQIKNLLKQQDDRIASLNERIEEQLKRYDEA